MSTSLFWLADRDTVEAVLNGVGWRQVDEGDGYVVWGRGALRVEFSHFSHATRTASSTRRRPTDPPAGRRTRSEMTSESSPARVPESSRSTKALLAEKSAGYGGPEAHAKDQADVAALRELSRDP